MGGQSLSFRKTGDECFMKMSTTMIVSNFVLFQIGWFACVLSAAAHQPWFGVLVTTGVVVTARASRSHANGGAQTGPPLTRLRTRL